MMELENESSNHYDKQIAETTNKTFKIKTPERQCDKTLRSTNLHINEN